MAGQLERCMEAGMDGFLTKPIEIVRLHETLDHYGFGRGTPEKTSDAAQNGAPTTPVDLARIEDITQGDAEFACELATTFVASGEQVLQEIRTAFAAFDRPALSRAAHKLKGASANVHAEGLRGLSYALESQAAGLDQPRLKELIEQLVAEFGRAARFLEHNTRPPQAQAS
jgi:HPt (histidine-containing phosphotransfer) domain-containing protein